MTGAGTTNSTGHWQARPGSRNGPDFIDAVHVKIRDGAVANVSRWPSPPRADGTSSDCGPEDL